MNNICCPICSSSKISSIFSIEDVPIHIGTLWPSKEAAVKCPKGDIELVFCNHCSFLTNTKFDPGHPDYTEEYDNSLHYSGTYQEYALSQANRLINDYEIHNKTVLEIGCGKGDFLRMLCDLGSNRGIGFDPTFEEDRGIQDNLDILFIKDLYSKKYSHYKADLYCSRYVLEHIPAPMSFLQLLHENLEPAGEQLVYFEVPNAMLILKDLSVWDIIYEHCSYFTLESLTKSFSLAGFSVLNSGSSFENQFIYIEAQVDNSQHADEAVVEPEDYSHLPVGFQKTHPSILNAWSHEIKKAKEKSKNIALWGAGAKTVSFLNMLKIDDEIESVVDINPNKEGKFIPGSGQRIFSPGHLGDLRPDVVIIMNPVYRDEIERSLREMGLSPEIMTVLDSPLLD